MIRRCFKSRTMWFAIIVAIFGALFDYLPFVKEFIDPKIYGYLLVSIGVIVAILRSVTSQPMKDK